VLENRQLSGLFLLCPLKMQSQDCFVHDARQVEDAVYLLLGRHPSVLVLESYRNFGFEKFFLLIELAYLLICLINSLNCQV
jgi:hypothetical protein